MTAQRTGEGAPQDAGGTAQTLRQHPAPAQRIRRLLVYGVPMSEPPQSPTPASPLTARLYDLEYPRSLGVYSTYQEVQSVVDTLADNQFPVQSTLIVGTDLKLMERVTGRKTWPKVIGQGVLSGLWMGLFLGLLLLLINPGNFMIVLTSILMGIVFFTVWTVIGYAMTGGKRDFTSMTSTIPMQYELLVEHKHAAQARQILADSGAAPSPAPVPAPGHAPAPQGGHGPHYGSPAPQAPQSAPSAPAQPGRPSYGQPAPQSSPAQESGRNQQRPSFGQPAGTPLHESSSAPSAPPAEGGHGSPGATDAEGQQRPESPQEQTRR